MGERIGLVSRHVVVPREHLPIFALLLIDSEEIVDVVKLSETTEVSSLAQQHPAYSILDLQDEYISPGLIDCNVRVNALWESPADVSKTAIAGGVTLMLVEDSVYSQQAQYEALNCDVGRVTALSSVCDMRTDESVFAYKIYRYPPSAWQASFYDSLETLFARSAESGVPLMVDACHPEDRTMMLGSPYHHCSLEDRMKGKSVNEATFHPGAYQDEGRVGHSSSDSDGDEWVLLKPDRTQSSLEGFRLAKDTALPPISPVKIEDRRRPSKDLESLPCKPAVVRPTLIDSLNTRIKYHRSGVGPLNQAELKGYDSAGEYIYSAVLPAKRDDAVPANKRSLSTVPETVELLMSSGEKEDEGKTESVEVEKPKRKRALNLKVAIPPPQHSQDRDYLIHLANIPDHWETSGLPKLFKALTKSPCKLLFSNMSAASAVNEVRAFRVKTGLEVSIETCPHYLFFCMEEITQGDTRLKTFPPIRNKTNCNLLWELLKVKCVDIISSHHASLPPQLKFAETGSFKRAASGINGIGFSLPVVWTKLRMPSVDSPDVRERYIVRLAKWMSLAPARFLGIAAKRGSLERGKLADIVVWRPHSPFSAEGHWTKHSSLNSYSKKPLYGEIVCVFLRGRVAFQSGESRPVGRICQRRELL